MSISSEIESSPQTRAGVRVDTALGSESGREGSTGKVGQDLALGIHSAGAGRCKITKNNPEKGMLCSEGRLLHGQSMTRLC